MGNGLRLCHGGATYHVESSSLTCGRKQCTDFYIIEPSAMKDWRIFDLFWNNTLWSRALSGLQEKYCQ